MTKEEAIEMLKKDKEQRGKCFISDALDIAIKELEKEPKKKGMWFLTIEDWNKWTCSECGFSKRTDIHVMLKYNYCPNCGAKMKVEE